MNGIDNKKIAIIGFGKEGTSAANFLGQSNQIFIVDQKPKDQIDQSFFKKLKVKAKIYLGGNLPRLTFDSILRSPGVRPDNELISRLGSKRTIITSATKIFFDLCPCEIIGVTGTKGKGTTSTLIHKMIKLERNSYLAGNIGTPMLEILPILKQKDLVVLELSSFQLMDLEKSPHISVILMITSEHLDWHKDKREYTNAKIPIVAFQNPSDFAVINHDFPISLSFARKTRAKVYFFSTKNETSGVFVKNQNVFSNIPKPHEVINIKKIALPGKHNLQNVTASVAVAKILGIKNENIQKVLASFKGLPHRLQKITTIKGVSFYNDSFSTTPETTIAAIRSLEAPKILILGGSSKNSDFRQLAKEISRNEGIKAIILIGVEGPRIKKFIKLAGGFRGKIIEGAKSMKAIIQKAISISSWGDIVLLSPACASFDMFKNYQDRGDQFTQEVKNLSKNNGF